MLKPMRHLLRAAVILLIGFGVSAPVAIAQQTSATNVGPVTSLPLPRFVSLKGVKANVRRGPSQSHRIDWVLMHRGTPLQITAEFEHWRRVRDQDNVGGWIHYSLLSGHRTVVVQGQRIPLHAEPTETSRTIALAEKGVVASVGTCIPDWCEIETDGFSGWVMKSGIWGIGSAEIRE
ncbi:aspartyl-trna synthetase [Rhodobacterales bacterium 52_120_T64]|nr:aspartyl-trna synthetase [Rhodobacterales bacterium 52_120_T64]